MNENDNALISVPDLVERLNTTGPRLRRYLKKPEFADHLGTMARTGPGTKTQTGVPVSLIPALKKALESEKSDQEQKQKQALSFPDEAVSRYIAAMTAQANERIEEQAKTIADLRSDKAELKEEREQLRTQVSSLSSEIAELRMIVARAQKNTPQNASDAPETGAGVSSHSKPPKVPDPDPQPPASDESGTGQGQMEQETTVAGKPETGTTPQARRWWEIWRKGD